MDESCPATAHGKEEDSSSTLGREGKFDVSCQLITYIASCSVDIQMGFSRVPIHVDYCHMSFSD